MKYQIWLNGEYVDRDKATISMNDRGFKLGDVVFDTSRTFNGTVFRLRDHLVRLYRSLKFVRLDPGMSIDEMERLTLEVVARNEAGAQKFERRLHDHADRHRRQRTARGAAERVDLALSSGRAQMGAGVRRGRACRHSQDSRILSSEPRPEGQALQSDELRSRRARGGGPSTRTLCLSFWTPTATSARAPARTS